MQVKMPDRTVERLLVVMPTWVGDTVMATPTLRSLRMLYPQAQITALARHAVQPLLGACPWIDHVIEASKPRETPSVDKHRKTLTCHRRTRSDRTRLFPLVRQLAGEHFDTAVILPNSFRTALLVRLANIPRRIGYNREGRGCLLTDRLLPFRKAGQFVPVPTLDYYLGIARYLGAVKPDPRMQLFTRPDDDARANQILADLGYQARDGRCLVLISPGASYGDAKRWMPERFASVADLCVSELGAVVSVSGAPNERPIIEKMLGSVVYPVLDLAEAGINLTLFKSVMARCHLLITNDTGPRHIAAAMDVPVVTIFGPTDPVWSEIDFELERKIMFDVECRPCQKKQCPLRGTPEDHQCMKRIGPDVVYETAVQLLQASRLVESSR